jgi:hypothetical protein
MTHMIGTAFESTILSQDLWRMRSHPRLGSVDDDYEDPLFRLQLQVARRADEMLRDDHAMMPSLFAWIRAEREVLTLQLAYELESQVVLRME